MLVSLGGVGCAPRGPRRKGPPGGRVRFQVPTPASFLLDSSSIKIGIVIKSTSEGGMEDEFKFLM